MSTPGSAATSVPPAHADHSIVATLQSLTVAFVLAMAFRGFVLEGFVIPTGSMAPTLMGQHSRWTSQETGYGFPVDTSPNVLAIRAAAHTTGDIFDPMLPARLLGNPVNLNQLAAGTRMGDRILIVKCLYPFSPPGRWDVVVFKNPTDPTGDTENYIKRLIGLPGEKVWLADGDVFAGPATPTDETQSLDGYMIQRKPEHVQRAVWQPVYDSRYVIRAAAPSEREVPWLNEDGRWEISGRRDYRCDTADRTTLEWNAAYRPIDDWTAYNMLVPRLTFNVSDVRVAAAVVPDQSGLQTELNLFARSHVFQFRLTQNGRAGKATVRFREENQKDQWLEVNEADVALPEPGHVYNVEFWHVDQSMSIYVDGRRVAHLEYNWSPTQRVENATGRPYEQVINDLLRPGVYQQTAINWSFSGSPLTLHRVRLDRDLFYRPAMYEHPGRSHQAIPGNEREKLVVPGTPAYGTRGDKPAVLNSDQFFMCGDNSPASQDSRLWGAPHPLVAAQIDPKPFVVHRKLLLGKAWLVYFPAPHPLTDRGPGVVPDFDGVRFIR